MDGKAVKYDSLTDPPTNLKESIDWVLRISGKDGGAGGSWGMSELLTLILKFFSKPDQELIEAVKKSFNDAVERVTKEIGDKIRGTSLDFADYLRKLAVRSVGNTIHVDLGDWLTSFKGWLEKGCNPICEADGPMAEFVNGLAVFMGYYNGQLNDEGLAKNGSYESAYHATNATWDNVKENEKKEKCAMILLDVVITLFPLLSLLYWNGRREKLDKRRSGDGRWADNKLNDPNSSLSKFLTTVGFSDFSQLNISFTTPRNKKIKLPADTSMKGSTLSGRLQTAFPEFGRVMAESGLSMTTYGDFLAALIACAQCDTSSCQRSTNAIVCGKLCETSDPSKFPFTKLFIFSTAYKIAVVTTSPQKAILASAAVVTGVGVGAYLTYLSGILPALGIF
ncbi:variant erythrocyte surface antigen-1 family protein [Babesia caballi]|uniref:Variant erythrocyte surface antigen-1 family protein n=1 Tax=Babesia caballi TaxID=5871 RepID=A0AAV4LQI8_BABCB|nr:variant erythrocyte surface antigen-1 family protein [Babesia caballi]